MKSDLKYESTNPQGNVVDIDMLDPEHKQAQSPMDLSPDATADEFAKVVALSVDKYCSVASSLKSSIRYTSEIRRSV